MELYRFVKECDYNKEVSDTLVVDNRRVICKSYEPIKETASSWIVEDFTGKKGRRVISKTSRKKFAYPDINDALENFILRSEKHIRILEYQLKDAKLFLDIAKKIEL